MIALDHRLGRRQRNATLAHELIHDERGIGQPTATPAMMEREEVIVREIAALLRVEAQTARNWRTRGVLPEPDWTVSGGPAWSWPRVAAWAMRTGRL